MTRAASLKLVAISRRFDVRSIHGEGEAESFFAQYEASKTGSSAIEVEHLTLGVLHADLALGWKVFPSRDDIHKVRDRIEREIPKGAEVTASVDIR